MVSDNDNLHMANVKTYEKSMTLRHTAVSTCYCLQISGVLLVVFGFCFYCNKRNCDVAELHTGVVY